MNINEEIAAVSAEYGIALAELAKDPTSQEAIKANGLRVKLAGLYEKRNKASRERLKKSADMPY